MADIFLSYSRADRDRVAALATALGEQGWEVFWDTVVLPGQQWRDVIHEQLEEATCVVAVWSEASSTSRWVVEEASEALDNGKLLPVMIDEVDPPFGFRGVEAADLVGWHHGIAHPGFDVLVDALTARIGASPRDEGGEGGLTAVDEESPEADATAVGDQGPFSAPPVVGVAGTSVVPEVAAVDGPASETATNAESIQSHASATGQPAPVGDAVGSAEPEGGEAVDRTDLVPRGNSAARSAAPSPPAVSPETDRTEPPIPWEVVPPPVSPSKAPPEGPARDLLPPGEDAESSPTPQPTPRPPSPDAVSQQPAAGRTTPAVPPKEAPTRPEEPPSPAPLPGGPGRGVWFALGGVLVVAAVAVFLVFAGNGGEEEALVPSTVAGGGAEDGGQAQEVFAPDLVEADQIIAEAAPGVMTIDGATDDWIGVERAYRLRHFVRDTGAVERRLGEDSPGVVAVAHDDSAFYVFVSVADDIYSQPNEGNQIWRGDAFDINISTVPVDATPSRPDGRTFQLTITPLSEITGRPGAVLFVGNGEQFFDNTTSLPLTVEGAVDASGRWTLEAQIPWTVFGLGGPPGDGPYSALFSVFDNDGEVTSSGRSQQTVILGHLPDAAFQSDLTTWGSFDVGG